MVRLYFQTLESGETPAPAAHRLLERLLEIAPAALQYDGSGRPFVPGGPCISLSHTAGAAAVAISSCPVGVDVEGLRPVRDGLPRRVMGPGEYRRYLSAGARQEDFFTLWTLKESYYKYLGTGLPGFPNGTDFVQEDGRWRLTGAPQRFFVFRKKQLLIALCSDEQQMELIDVSGSSD